MRSDRGAEDDLTPLENTVIDIPYQAVKAAERARQRACMYRWLDCGREFSISITGAEEAGALDKDHEETCPNCRQLVGYGRVKCRRCQAEFILAFLHWHVSCDLAGGKCPQCEEWYS